MWCETTPLLASPNRNRHDDRRVFRHLSPTRVGIGTLSGHIGFTENDRRDGDSATRPVVHRPTNDETLPASGGHCWHPETENRGHFPSHIWEAWQETPSQAYGKPAHDRPTPNKPP